LWIERHAGQRAGCDQPDRVADTAADDRAADNLHADTVALGDADDHDVGFRHTQRVGLGISDAHPLT
jgi:hypothetical protein